MHTYTHTCLVHACIHTYTHAYIHVCACVTDHYFLKITGKVKLVTINSYNSFYKIAVTWQYLIFDLTGSCFHVSLCNNTHITTHFRKTVCSIMYE